MPSSLIKAWQSDELSSVTWIEYDDYAKQVFAGSPSDWFQDPVQFAATIIEAHQVIPTQVLSIDALGPYLQRYHSAPALKESVSTDTAVDTVCNLLGNKEAFTFVSNVIDALAHSLAGNTDLVLRLLSPMTLLKLFDTNNESEPGFDDMDDVGVALTNFVREFSEKPLTGILVVSDAADNLTDDESEACESLFATARHYGWLTSIAMKKYIAPVLPSALLESVDIILLPEISAEIIDRTCVGIT